jgi:hypothetical protein
MAVPKKQQLLDCFDEHLPYEIEMLRITYELLHKPVVVQVGGEEAAKLVLSAMMESFSIHVRNLVEFFKYKEPCDFSPGMFAIAGYPLKTRFVNDSILTKINTQIAHLTTRRTRVDQEKFNRDDDWQHAYEAIEREISRLYANLSDEWRPRCKFEPHPSFPHAGRSKGR